MHRLLRCGLVLFAVAFGVVRPADASDFYSPTLVATTGQTLNCYFTSMSTTTNPVSVGAPIIGSDGNGVASTNSCPIGGLILGAQTTCSSQTAGPIEAHCHFNFAGVTTSKARGAIVVLDGNGSVVSALEATP